MSLSPVSVVYTQAVFRNRDLEGFKEACEEKAKFWPNGAVKLNLTRN